MTIIIAIICWNYRKFALKALSWKIGIILLDHGTPCCQKKFQKWRSCFGLNSTEFLGMKMVILVNMILVAPPSFSNIEILNCWVMQSLVKKLLLQEELLFLLVLHHGAKVVPRKTNLVSMLKSNHLSGKS